MPLLGLFSRPLLLDSTPTPSSFVPDQSTPSPNKALLPPHLRGPNPDDAAAVQTAPIDEGYEEKGVLSWLTPFTTPRPKNKSAGAEWDMSNLYVLIAGLAVSTSAPKLLKIKTQQGKIAIALGTWTVCSALLVRNLNEKFWEAEKDNRLKLKEEALYKRKQAQLGLSVGENFETGFGGQEGLKDKFATTRGDH